jgi:hypothetical protein
MAQSSATSLVTLRPTINQLTKHGHGMIKPLSSCSSFAFHADGQSLAFLMRSDWEWNKISSIKARRVERSMDEDNRDHSPQGSKSHEILKPTVICKPEVWPRRGIKRGGHWLSRGCQIAQPIPPFPQSGSSGRAAIAVKQLEGSPIGAARLCSNMCGKRGNVSLTNRFCHFQQAALRAVSLCGSR